MAKKELNFSRILLFFILIYTLSFATAAVNLDDLHLNIQTVDGTGKVITGTYNFEFNISTSNTCTPVIYSDSATLSTDSRGIVSYYLSNVSLDYSDQYYLCYYRDNVLIETSKIARSPYAFRAKYVDLGGVEVTQNFDLGVYNVSATNFFGDGSGLTNLNASSVNYWLKNNSNLYYNSGNIGIGTGSPDKLLTIEKNSANGAVVNSMVISGKTQSTIVDGGGQVISFRGNSGRYWGAIGGYTANSKEGIGIFAGLSTSLPSIPQLYVNSDGNVGIGTTTPGAKLEILQVGGAWSGGIRINNSLLGGYWDIMSDPDLRIGGNGNARMIIKQSTGNVGIGTTNPQEKLTIKGNLHLTNDNSILWSQDAISTSSFATSKISGIRTSGSGGQSGYLSFFTKNTTGTPSILTERMRITENGNLGINTTTPQNTLNVVGEGNFTGNVYSNGVLLGGSGQLNSTGWNRSGADVYLANTNDNVGIGIINPSTKLTVIESAGSTPVAYFENTNGSYSSTSLVKIKGNGGPTAGSFLFNIIRGSTPIFNTRWDGNVGVGIASPTTKLQVDVSSDNDGLLVSKSGVKLVKIGQNGGLTDGKLTIYDNNGNADINLVADTNSYFMNNVGIGITNPSKKLEVAGDIAISAGGVIGQGNSYGTPGNTYDGYLALYDGSTGYTTLQSASAYGLLLNPNGGNVGIGTSSPGGYKLNVQGSTRFNGTGLFDGGLTTYGNLVTASRLTSNYGADINYNGLDSDTTIKGLSDDALFFVDAGNDRIGIGTTSPSQKLEVSGNVNITQNITISGMTIYKDTSGDMVFRA